MSNRTFRCRFCKNLEQVGNKAWKCRLAGVLFTEHGITRFHGRSYPECSYDERDRDIVTGLYYTEFVNQLRANVLAQTISKERKMNCFRCDKEIYFSQDEIYCDECRDAGRAEDREKIKFYLADNGLMRGLVDGIVRQVCIDYQKNLKKLIKAYTKKGNPVRMYWSRKDQLEYYMFSKDFAVYNLDERNIPKLIQELQEEVGFYEEDYERPND